MIQANHVTFPQYSYTIYTVCSLLRGVAGRKPPKLHRSFGFILCPLPKKEKSNSYQVSNENRTNHLLMRDREECPRFSFTQIVWEKNTNRWSSQEHTATEDATQSALLSRRRLTAWWPAATASTHACSWLVTTGAHLHPGEGDRLVVSAPILMVPNVWSHVRFVFI